MWMLEVAMVGWKRNFKIKLNERTDAKAFVLNFRGFLYQPLLVLNKVMVVFDLNVIERLV